jgi:calnexin
MIILLIFILMSCFFSRLDWDESEPKEFPDESASIPDGWLETESAMIPDPAAVKPADW